MLRKKGMKEAHKHFCRGFFTYIKEHYAADYRHSPDE